MLFWSKKSMPTRVFVIAAGMCNRNRAWFCDVVSTQYILRCFDEIEMSKANGYKIH